MESQRSTMIEQSFDCYSTGLQESLDQLPYSFIITDPYISGNPIVYASRGFLEMFGYLKYEVIGRNGRIFQGPKTNRRSVLEVREAIQEERDIQISLLNYKKDGTPFWMLFHMCPVFDEKDGRVIHFLGVQVPILRRPKPSKVGLNLCQDGAGCRESVLRCYRREVYSMSVERELSFASGSSLDFTGVDVQGPCDANDQERTKATAVVNNILAVLIHDGESTGRLVCGKRRSPSGMGLLGPSLNISLGRIKQSFILTDANLPDMPIVFASDTFLKLTGFSKDEVLGYNCRSLSVINAESSSQFRMKECIQNEQPRTLRMYYRKDGTSFWLHISPVRNASGKVAYYVAVEGEDNSETKEKEGLRQRVVAAVKVAVRGLSMGVRAC